MPSDRKKPGVAFWATVVVVAVLVGYPLSFGPACWATGWCGLKGDWLLVAYDPIIWTFNHGPIWLDNALTWYSLVGAPEPCGWFVNGDGMIIGFRSWR